MVQALSPSLHLFVAMWNTLSNYSGGGRVRIRIRVRVRVQVSTWTRAGIKLSDGNV